MKELDFNQKISKILTITLLVLFLILIRVWQLAVIEREDRLKDSMRPKRKTIHIHANRGAIYDRYGQPLAVNKICYNASVYYANIRQIPSVKWMKKALGKKIKTYPRKEHIEKISYILSKELNMDRDYVEDLIHSKAAIFPHIPYTLKENISEKVYFRLKMLERDNLGILGEISSKRHYPHGKAACDILGYLGAINSDEYYRLANEISFLSNNLKKIHNNEYPTLPKGYNFVAEIENRLKTLKKKTYFINDLIGKSGVEKQFEHLLRGAHGKKIFEVDIKGNFLKEIAKPKIAKPGKDLTLSISLELQQFAEKILANDEEYREGESRYWDGKKQVSVPLKQPWIKGGSIIAINPNNGQIVALASYPRFNPNDFIKISNPEINIVKQKNINMWLEKTNHIKDIWDGNKNLTRDFFSYNKNIFYEDQSPLTLDNFLDFLTPKTSNVYSAFKKINTLKNAAILQEDIEALIFFLDEKDAAIIFDTIFPEHEQINKFSKFNLLKKHHILAKKIVPLNKQTKINKNLAKKAHLINPIKIRLLKNYFSQIPHNKDKLFLADICKIIVNSQFFSNELLEKVQTISLTEYWDLSKISTKLSCNLKKHVYDLFIKNDYKVWSQNKKKAYIKKKRIYEKKKKIKYAKPYIDYLNIKKEKLFSKFWQRNKIFFLYSFLTNKKLLNNKKLSVYFDSIVNNKSIASTIDITNLQKHIKTLPQKLSLEFLKTFRSFDDLNRPLFGKYHRVRKNINNVQLEKHLAASFYPINGFSYGRSHCFSQVAPMGSLFKLVTGYGALNESYYSYKPLNSFTITDSYKWDSKACKGGSIVVGYLKDGTALTRHYKGGRLPRSAHADIGRVDIVEAIAQSSNPFFSLLAKEHLKSSNDLVNIAKTFGFGQRTKISLPNETPGYLPKDLSHNTTGLYSFAIGQHSFVATPLQAACMLSTFASNGKYFTPSLLKNDPPIIQKNISMPKPVKNLIFEGMDKVVTSENGSARFKAIKRLFNTPIFQQDYKDLSHQFIGKTSTAEIMFNPYILPSSTANMYKHIWFGSISFKNESNKSFDKMDKTIWNNPELVVVVYLRYGSGGKEAAPLAVQIIKKYRELEKKYSKK
jgi:cell division protein FtsI/penicillin-binding protein 2